MLGLVAGVPAGDDDAAGRRGGAGDEGGGGGGGGGRGIGRSSFFFFAKSQINLTPTVRRWPAQPRLASSWLFLRRCRCLHSGAVGGRLGVGIGRGSRRSSAARLIFRLG